MEDFGKNTQIIPDANIMLDVNSLNDRVNKENTALSR